MKAENDERVREWVRGVRDKVQRELERRQGEEGVDEVTREGVGEYGNYDGEWFLLLQSSRKLWKVLI
jgi:hypothetical protein